MPHTQADANIQMRTMVDYKGLNYMTRCVTEVAQMRLKLWSPVVPHPMDTARLKGMYETSRHSQRQAERVTTAQSGSNCEAQIHTL